MFIESIINIRKGYAGEEISIVKVTLPVLMVQGVATAIDALSVGFTIAGYGWIMALICSLIIAVTTYSISVVGIHIGKKVGTKLSNKAGILGGGILIYIGLELFIKGVFFS